MASTTVKRTGVTLRNSEAGDEHGKAIPAQIYHYPTRRRPRGRASRTLNVSKVQERPE